MSPETWILLAASGTIAAAVVYLKVLVFGLQTEIRRLQRRLDDRPQSLPAAAPAAATPAPAAAAGVEKAVEHAVQHAFRDQMKRLLEHTLDTSGAAASPPPAPPSPPPQPQQPGESADQRWSPERRFRIIAMAERGEQPDRIAAALRIPVSEVELFLRVHQIARA